MVMIDINGTERYYDGYLVQNLEIYKEAVAKNWDGVFYVGGYEGDAKSTFTEQLAVYVDRTYNITRCCFTPTQFLKAIEEADEGEAIVLDEGQDVFESTARDKTARLVKSVMTRIRKKKLYIFIIAPDFWRINKYLFIHRSRAFIRVYANGLERGFFELYNREKKHKLMVMGKRNEVLCVPPNFRGRFTHWFVLDRKEYENKKDKAATQMINDFGKKQDDKYDEVRVRILEADFITNNEKGLLLGVTSRQISRSKATRRAKVDGDG